MKRLALILLVLPTLGLSNAALAQEEEEAPPRKILYQKSQEIDFDVEIEIEGALDGPSGGLHSESRRPRFIPMTSVRENFNPEMEASIDDMK